jgi:hypothetical protein
MSNRYSADNPIKTANTEMPNAPDPNFGYVPPMAPNPMLGARPPMAPDWTDSYADRMPNAPEPMTGSYAPFQPNTPDPVTRDYRPQQPGQLALVQDFNARPAEAPPPDAPEPLTFRPPVAYQPDLAPSLPEGREWPLVHGAELERVNTYWHN